VALRRAAHSSKEFYILCINLGTEKSAEAQNGSRAIEGEESFQKVCRKLHSITASYRLFVLYHFIRCARNGTNYFLSILCCINNTSHVKEIPVANSFSSKNILIKITLPLWEMQLKIIFGSVLVPKTARGQNMPPSYYDILFML
jgi:hypothetical protein